MRLVKIVERWKDRFAFGIIVGYLYNLPPSCCYKETDFSHGLDCMAEDARVYGVELVVGQFSFAFAFAYDQ